MFETIAHFIAASVVQGTPLLFGATGEIITEKSGNLNLGTPGIMYVGGISGIIGAYLYEHFCAAPVTFWLVETGKPSGQMCWSASASSTATTPQTASFRMSERKRRFPTLTALLPAPCGA